MTQTTSNVDDFTRDHLARWCEHAFPWYDQDNADAFYAYAIARCEEEPELLDLGWPVIRRSYDQEMQERSAQPHYTYDDAHIA